MSQRNSIEKSPLNKQPEKYTLYTEVDAEQIDSRKNIRLSRVDSMNKVDECSSSGLLGSYDENVVLKPKKVKSRSGTPVLRNPDCRNQPVFEVNQSCSSLDREDTSSTSNVPFTTQENYRNMNDICTYSVTISQKVAEETVDGIRDEPNNSSMKKSSFINIHSTDVLQGNTTLPEDNIAANVEILSVNDVFPSTSEESVEKMEWSTCKYVSSDCNISTVSKAMRVVGSNPGEPKMKYEEPVKRSSKLKMKNFFRKLDKRKSTGSEQKVVTNKNNIRSILKVAPDLLGDSPQETNKDYHSNYDGEGDKTLDFPIDTISTLNTPKCERPTEKTKAVSFNSNVSVLFVSYVGGDARVTGSAVQTLSREADQQARSAELRKSYSIFKMTRYPHISLVQFSPHPGKCAQFYRNCHL